MPNTNTDVPIEIYIKVTKDGPYLVFGKPEIKEEMIKAIRGNMWTGSILKPKTIRPRFVVVANPKINLIVMARI